MTHRRRLAAALIVAALVIPSGSAGAMGPQTEGLGRERTEPVPGETRSPAGNRAGGHPGGPATDRWRGPCSGWQLGETLRARDFGTPVYVRRIHRLYDCIFARWAPAYRIAFRAVITREAGDLWNAWAKNPQTTTACRPWSDNPYGSCGLAQHLARYWPARVLFNVWPRWFAAWPRISPLDPRANLIVTARMVARSGICPHWC